MGVIVKEMTMPDTCDQCRFLSEDKWCYAQAGHPKVDLKRNCPLANVKVPHKRLIDADELIHVIITRLGVKASEFLYPNEMLILECIDEAPTIMEEET